MSIVGEILLKNLLPKDKKIVKSIAHKIFPIFNQNSHANDQISANKLNLMNSPFKIAKMNKNTMTTLTYYSLFLLVNSA